VLGVRLRVEAVREQAGNAEHLREERVTRARTGRRAGRGRCEAAGCAAAGEDDDAREGRARAQPLRTAVLPAVGGTRGERHEEASSFPSFSPTRVG
jgi:hypothetical protein